MDQRALTTLTRTTHIKVVKAIIKKVCGDTDLGVIKINPALQILPLPNSKATFLLP